MKLSRHRVLLTRDPRVTDESGGVYFAKATDMAVDLPALRLPPETWEAMGEPEEITVTVRPGSHFEDDETENHT